MNRRIKKALMSSNDRKLSHYMADHLRRKAANPNLPRNWIDLAHYSATNRKPNITFTIDTNELNEIT